MNHTYKPGAAVVFGLIYPTLTQNYNGKMTQNYNGKIISYTSFGDFKYILITSANLKIGVMPQEIVSLSDNVL